MIRNFNADGFSSLYPSPRGGRPPKFSLPQRREVKKIAEAKLAEYDLPFSAWSLPRLSWLTSWWLRGSSTTSAASGPAPEGVTFHG